MKVLKMAGVAALVAGSALAATIAPLYPPVGAHAATGAPYYRLWRDVVHEPGTVSLTFTDPEDVYDVQAEAVSASVNDWVMSNLVTQRGHVFTLTFRFPKGTKTGKWYAWEVSATPAGQKRPVFRNPTVVENLPFEVRS